MTPIDTPPPSLNELRQCAQDNNKSLWHSIKLELKTITPVYGGGTTAGEPDVLLPFRPRAIKNGLRHWWWLLNRHKPEYKNDSQRLYQDMTAIWGGASDTDAESKRAKVRVKVLNWMKPLIIQSIEYEKSLGYILWMTMQADLAEKGVPLIKPGCNFKLQIDISSAVSKDQMADLESVLNAWLHLGGIGARTTRGLGRIQVENMECTPEVTIQKYFSVNDQWFKNLSVITDKTTAVLDKKMDDAVKALEHSVSAFSTFRQARQLGILPNGKPSRINRSYWPKADVIRFLTKKYPDFHAPHANINSKQLPTPELTFGAPIVYRFKDSRRDPDTGVLTFAFQGSPLERFTSPLLLTVVRTQQGEYRPAAALFPYWNDLRDKQVQIENTRHLIQPGTWWPDISTDAGKAAAKKLLAGEVRHPPKKEYGEDHLYQALQNATSKGFSSPVASFLQFFKGYDKNIK